MENRRLDIPVKGEIAAIVDKLAGAAVFQAQQSWCNDGKPGVAIDQYTRIMRGIITGVFCPYAASCQPTSKETQDGCNYQTCGGGK